ncbi:MAG: hypothetical protein JNL70_02990 [Saprospiraceae bacterium]|nr:hypothetical protein [Saprospiraceae bacterium]
MSNINYTAIRRIKQDEFKTFADLVFDSTNGKPVYAPFQTAITDMQAKAEVFQSALIKSKNRGKSEIEAKNAAYNDLYQALVRIAKLMDANWQTNDFDRLKMDAGFTLNKTPERQEAVTYVLPPSNFKVYNDNRRGVIIVEWIKDANAVTTAFETQLNDGVWQNGVYNEGKKMEMTFPFGAKLVMRAKTIGPNLLTSDFVESDVVMVS